MPDNQQDRHPSDENFSGSSQNNFHLPLYTSVKRTLDGQEVPFMSNADLQNRPRKRLFIGLVCITAFLLCLLFLLGWIIPYIGFGNIHPSVPIITGCLLALGILTIVWATFGLVVQISTNKIFWGFSRIRGLTIRCFLPVMEMVGRMVGINATEVRRSFIKVNNQITLTHEESIPPEKLLILVPHCLQNSHCPVRVSYRLAMCKRCGACPIDSLLSIQEIYNVAVAIATGGSIARRIVVETRPALILAIACERDLSSGIQDTYPLPVFGILNTRPEGPCKNTQVEPVLIEQAIRFFIQPEYTKNIKPIYY